VKQYATECFAILALCAFVSPAASAADAKPNIVVILSDDQGYADVSFNPHHPPEINSPHTDALAERGVVCTQAYTTGHVCSPTRAGLMTGRYQQRFGIYTAGEGGSGVPLDETFFPQYLKPAGYTCGALGKWHLGLTLEYNAMNRGFDEFYGFMGRGAHDYFDLKISDHPIYRGLEPINDTGYLTDRITEEAVSFIHRHKASPFFLYVAYNAVHAPPQAPPDEIDNVTGDETRDTLLAMLKHLDDGVGAITKALDEESLTNNTLVIYLTDNGGSKVMHANNAPLRGYKQEDYEGGIRVPWIVSWPAELPGGTTCDVPMMSIDIMPTALAAAGLWGESGPTVDVAKPGTIYDGRSVLPALRGEVDTLHEQLYWSSGGREGKWAIRSGDWKLVGQQAKVELFNLANGPAESKDWSKSHADKVAELTGQHDAWLAGMAEPASGGGKRWDPNAPNPPRRSRREVD